MVAAQALRLWTSFILGLKTTDYNEKIGGYCWKKGECAEENGPCILDQWRTTYPGQEAVGIESGAYACTS